MSNRNLGTLQNMSLLCIPRGTIQLRDGRYILWGIMETRRLILVMVPRLHPENMHIRIFSNSTSVCWTDKPIYQFGLNTFLERSRTKACVENNGIVRRERVGKYWSYNVKSANRVMTKLTCEGHHAWCTNVHECLFTIYFYSTCMPPSSDLTAIWLIKPSFIF